MFALADDATNITTWQVVNSNIYKSHNLPHRLVYQTTKGSYVCRTCQHTDQTFTLYQKAMQTCNQN